VNRAKAAETAIENLIEAQKRLEKVRDAWEEEGCPVTTLGGATGRAVIAHPILEELRQLEKHVAHLRSKLWPGLAGRPAEAVPEPVVSLGPPPSKRQSAA
jgi:hypothetical protein